MALNEKDLSFIGNQHVLVRSQRSGDKVLIGFVPDHGGAGLGVEIPAISEDEAADIVALLQCSVQGPYLRASDMDKAQKAGWMPTELYCPTCNRCYAKYLDLWGHMLIDHGGVPNPYNERTLLVNPLA